MGVLLLTASMLGCIDTWAPEHAWSDNYYIFKTVLELPGWQAEGFVPKGKYDSIYDIGHQGLSTTITDQLAYLVLKKPSMFWRNKIQSAYLYFIWLLWL